MPATDWNDFRVALAIADHRSLSRAARALGLHQTTVGRRLDALEAALGFALFLRSPGGATPTGPAAPVLASLRELGHALGRLERHVEDATQIAGTVRLAVTETTARRLLLRTLPALRRAHPGLVVELVPGNQVVDLARGDADLAIRVVRPEDAALVARRLGGVRYGLYAAPAYLADRPGWTAELAGHDALWPSRELARGPEAAWLAAHAGQARPALWSSSLATLAEAAVAGMGLAVLPTNLAALHPGLALAAVLDDVPPRPVWLVMHRDTRGLARVRAVADRIADDVSTQLAAALGSGRWRRPAPGQRAR